MPQVFALARSEAANPALRSALAARELLPAHLPLLRLRRAYWSQSLHAQFEQALIADIRIYVSKFAVRAALGMYPPLASRQTGNFAVGSASARALARHGVIAVSPSNGAGSEPLLALPELDEVRGKQLAIFCAPDGRSWLAEQLSARGAQVVNVYCYRRATRPPTPLQVATCRRATLAFASSVAYLKALMPLLKSDAARGIPLLVASERIAEFARTHGFERVYACTGADDQAILTGLSQVKW